MTNTNTRPYQIQIIIYCAFHSTMKKLNHTNRVISNCGSVKSLTDKREGEDKSSYNNSHNNISETVTFIVTLSSQ